MPNLDEIMKAASAGRVAALVFNETAQEISTDDPQEDLLNAAALQTILHGGRAFAIPQANMPVKAEFAAVLRF